VASEVLPFSCSHDFQDKEYGEGLRLHTVSGTRLMAFCTVCGRAKELSQKAATVEHTEETKPITTHPII